MANQSTSKSIDVQGLITKAAVLELKVLNAGVEYWQIWINQAAKLSNIAMDTLHAIEENKGSVSGTVRRLTEFGKENAQVFEALSSRLSKRYFDEVGNFASNIESKVRRARPVAKAAKLTNVAKVTRRKASPGKRKAVRANP